VTDAKENCKSKIAPRIPGSRSAREDGLPPKPKSLSFHGRAIFRCRILKSSYYRLLSITPGDILNKIALFYDSSSNEAKTCREKYIFVQCSFSETAKKLKRRQRMRHLVTIFAASVVLRRFQMQSFNREFTLCIDIGVHPIAVKCLPIAAESFGWMCGFKWKSGAQGSIFQMDGRKAKLSEFMFADLTMLLSGELMRSQSGWRGKTLLNKALGKFKSFKS